MTRTTIPQWLPDLQNEVTRPVGTHVFYASRTSSRAYDGSQGCSPEGEFLTVAAMNGAMAPLHAEGHGVVFRIVEGDGRAELRDGDVVLAWVSVYAPRAKNPAASAMYMRRYRRNVRGEAELVPLQPGYSGFTEAKSAGGRIQFEMVAVATEHRVWARHGLREAWATAEPPMELPR